MTKLEATIQPTRFEAVKDALHGDWCGRHDKKGTHRVLSRTRVLRQRATQGKIETVVADRMVDQAIEEIAKTARTGKIGGRQDLPHPRR